MKYSFRGIFAFWLKWLLASAMKIAIINNIIPDVRNLSTISVIIEIPSNNPVATMGMKLQSRFAMTKLKIYLLVSFIYIHLNIKSLII